MESGTLSRNVLYYGTDAPPPAQIALRAGSLSLIYENGDLRYIRLGRREILLLNRVRRCSWKGWRCVRARSRASFSPA